MTNLTELALFTDDVAGASSFYRRLLGVEPVAEWTGGTLFAVGEGKLLVHERAAAMAEGPPNEDRLALGVHDLDAACSAFVSAGLAFLAEPRDYDCGRAAYPRDPDRRPIELAQA